MLNGKDGVLRWESYHSYCSGPDGKMGSVLGDKMFLTIKKFVDGSKKLTPKSISIKGEQNSLFVDGTDTKCEI